MPIVIRWILGAVVGFAGFKLLEYIVESINEEEAQPIVDEEVRKRGLKPTGILLKANCPTKNGIVFKPEELKDLASRSSYLEYDEEWEALRYTGDISKLVK